VVTEVFANLASTAARARGFSALPTLVLPHPMESRGEAEIRDMVHQRLAELAALLTT
jgi:hypothetical protein